MRQKRKIDKILLTTALVLVVAVLVALIFRMINEEKSPGPKAKETNLTQPAWLSEEGIFNVDGLIDRHHPDMELIFLLDEVQAPERDPLYTTFSSRAEELILPTKLLPSTTPAAAVTTTEGTTFRQVDIRYYVISRSGLNLRESPSTDSPVKQQLEYGKAIRVIALSKDWAKVRLAGGETGYVAKIYISQYPPVTTTSTTTTRATTTKAPTTRRPAVTGQGESPFQFVLSGKPDSIARANFNIIKEAGLVNKEISSSINRHYENFKDNGDGTITVDGITFSYLEKYGSCYATHYDGVEVCRYQIRVRGGKCSKGHTTPTNHNTGSGIPAQRGLVAVGSVQVDIYPRGTVLFIQDYGMAVVADRSGGNLDLCYDPDECSLLTRNNRVSGVYVIARP